MAAKQLPIRLPPELRARVDAEAERLGISVNAVIVMTLDRALPVGGDRPVQAPPTPARPKPADDVADFD